MPTYNATGEGCIYEPETHTVSAAREGDLMLSELQLLERILRARFQLGLLQQSLKDMRRLLDGKTFKPWPSTRRRRKARS